MEDLSVMRRLHHNTTCAGLAERFVDGEDVVEGDSGGGLFIFGGGDVGEEETETVAVFDCHCCA